jgi:hypothetical protein
MKKSILLFVKCLIPVLIYMLLSKSTDALITPLFKIDLSHIIMPGQSETLIGLFTVAVIQILVLALIAHRSKLDRKNLAILLTCITFTINHVLNTIESLVFLRNIYSVPMQMFNLLIGLIVSLGVSYTVAYLFGSKKQSNEEIPKFLWSKKLILSWTSWIIIWFIIYFIAGLLIPMNITGVKEFYFSGEGSAMDMSLVPVGYLMQIPRASFWILLAIALQKYQNGSNWEKSLVTGIVFGCLMSSSLLIPNFLMPDFVRMAHLPEILFANLLWGIIISWKVKSHFKEVK